MCGGDGGRGAGAFCRKLPIERARATACSGPVLPVVALGAAGSAPWGAAAPAGCRRRTLLFLATFAANCLRARAELSSILPPGCSASIYALSLTLHVSHKKETRARAPARARAPGLVAVRVWAFWAPAGAAGARRPERRLTSLKRRAGALSKYDCARRRPIAEVAPALEMAVRTRHCCGNYLKKKRKRSNQ